MVGGTRHHPSLVALLLYPEVEEYHTGTEYGIRNTHAQASIKFVDSMALMTDKTLLAHQPGLAFAATDGTDFRPPGWEI